MTKEEALISVIQKDYKDVIELDEIYSNIDSTFGYGDRTFYVITEPERVQHCEEYAFSDMEDFRAIFKRSHFSILIPYVDWHDYAKQSQKNYTDEEVFSSKTYLEIGKFHIFEKK